MSGLFGEIIKAFLKHSIDSCVLPFILQKFPIWLKVSVDFGCCNRNKCSQSISKLNIILNIYVK